MYRDANGAMHYRTLEGLRRHLGLPGVTGREDAETLGYRRCHVCRHWCSDDVILTDDGWTCGECRRQPPTLRPREVRQLSACLRRGEPARLRLPWRQYVVTLQEATDAELRRAHVLAGLHMAPDPPVLLSSDVETVGLRAGRRSEL